MRNLNLTVVMIVYVFLSGCAGQHTLSKKDNAATSSSDVATHENRGLALAKKGDLEGAVREYRTAIRLDEIVLNLVEIGVAAPDVVKWVSAKTSPTHTQEEPHETDSSEVG
ncbi:MAG: tetratricopeptide repeat protein, partial [Nitrospirota bacterium]